MCVHDELIGVLTLLDCTMDAGGESNLTKLTLVLSILVV